MLLEPIAEGLTYQDLQSYARTLLASTAESKTRSSNGIRDPAVFHAGEDQGQGMDGVSGCREAVEILTRNPKKREYLFHFEVRTLRLYVHFFISLPPRYWERIGS